MQIASFILANAEAIDTECENMQNNQTDNLI